MYCYGWTSKPRVKTEIWSAPRARWSRATETDHPLSNAAQGFAFVVLRLHPHWPLHFPWMCPRAFAWIPPWLGTLLSPRATQANTTWHIHLPLTSGVSVWTLFPLGNSFGTSDKYSPRTEYFFKICIPIIMNWFSYWMYSYWMYLEMYLSFLLDGKSLLNSSALLAQIRWTMLLPNSYVET